MQLAATVHVGAKNPNGQHAGENFFGDAKKQRQKTMSAPPAADATAHTDDAPFDRTSAVEATLARARAARTRRQLGTVSSQPPLSAAGGQPSSAARYAQDGAEISVPSGNGSYHPHAERKLQRLRQREENAAAQLSEHKAAMSVIATVPDPGTRRQALRTMSASARVAALLTMPEKEVHQISRAVSRPVPVAMAFAAVAAAASRDGDEEASASASASASADATEQAGPEGEEVLLLPSSHFAPHNPAGAGASRNPLTSLRENSQEQPQAQDEWIESLRRKHALPSPVVGSAGSRSLARAASTGRTPSGAGSEAQSGGGGGDAEASVAAATTSSVAQWKGRAIAAEDELRVTKAELAGLHGDIEVMLSTMAQVTQVSTIHCTAEDRAQRSAQGTHEQIGSGQIRLDLRAAQRSLVADTSLCCVLAGWLAGWHTGARCTLSSSWGAGTAHDNSRGGRKRPAASGQCRAVGAPDRRHRERRRRSASAPHATRQL